MKIWIGAIAGFAPQKPERPDHGIDAVLVRPERFCQPVVKRAGR